MANGFNKFAAISEDEKHVLSTAERGRKCIKCGLRIEFGQAFDERLSQDYDGYDRWHLNCDLPFKTVKTDEIVPVRQETDLERMYRVSLDVATKDNNQLRAERGLLQVRLDYKDAAVVKMQQIQEAELRDLRFERDRLYNHPLMRFVRWLKGWDWMAGRE